MARGRSLQRDQGADRSRCEWDSITRDGDTVTLIKDLKVRGTSSVLKMGTKIKQIRIVDGDHDIDCKTDLGPMMLKSEFLKKS